MVSAFETVNLVSVASLTDLWVWAGCALLLTAALGFAAGVLYARMSVKWAFRRARTRLSKLYTLVLETLETAQDTCSLLERFPDLLLTAEQSEKLERKQIRLLETVSRIVEAQRQIKSAAVEQTAHKVHPEEFSIDWLRSPEDLNIGVPDRSAFDANLKTMLKMGCQAEIESALMLIKVDKLDHLKNRFDIRGSETFMRLMASLVCRALRDKDLLCRFGDDTFAVLMPGTHSGNGPRLAQAIRSTVRNHHFRLEESGPEVLVTASFGYTVCYPEDNIDLALNRAGNALAKSQRRGRNQLHVHNGNTLVHCLTG